MQVGEGRLGERRGEKEEGERRVGKDKVEKNMDFNLRLYSTVIVLEVKPKKGLKQLNWSYRGPLSILAFKILFKSIVISKD